MYLTLYFSVYVTFFEFFAPLLFACSLVSDLYIGPVFRLFTEHRTSLETSSPPATSVHQDDTLTYAVFVLETLNFFFLLLAYVSLGASNFVLVSYF